MFDALQKLFTSTRVRRFEEPFCIARLAPAASLEGLLRLDPRPLCVTIEPDGATVFCTAAALPALAAATSVAEHDGPWTLFGLDAPFDFSVFGYLARVCAALAEHDIPVLSLATYRRDFLLVPGARGDAAEEILDALVLGGGAAGAAGPRRSSSGA